MKFLSRKRKIWYTKNRSDSVFLFVCGEQERNEKWSGSRGAMNSVMTTGDLMQQTVKGLLTQVEQASDREHAKKVKQLLEKAESERLFIAFCGHFSAGKSSLINRLCGHPLLPSSPIPTSANIVRIACGEAGAHVVYRDEAGSKERVERVPLEGLAEHCRNGEAIETVEIRYPIPFLGEHAALLDTPGIDSTDDAHHLATESALHLADVVFYVMDYNHVQSEINLSFTKKMKEWGKPLYLIINMIDKHREAELPFAAYQAGVREAFASWGVQPDGILYTSVKEPDHPHSEWVKLDWLLSRLISLREPLMRLSLEKSAKALAAAHAAKMAERNEPAKEALRAKLDADEGLEEAQRLYAEASAELKRLEALPQEREAALRKDVTAVLDNANVIPAVTRDLAHEYLQSRKPGFKVGWFAGAAKTAKEVERRLEEFHKDFATQVETQVARHVQQTVKAGFEGSGLPSAELISAAESIHVNVTADWMASLVNEGAVFGNEYTLTFSKQLSAEVKGQYRKEAFAVLEALAVQLAEALAPRRAELQRLAAPQERLSGLRQLERLAAEEAAYAASLATPLAALAAPAPARRTRPPPLRRRRTPQPRAAARPRPASPPRGSPGLRRRPQGLPAKPPAAGARRRSPGASIAAACAKPPRGWTPPRRSSRAWRRSRRSAAPCGRRRSASGRAASRSRSSAPSAPANRRSPMR
ncbi:dynamin family protein [Paenibacillus sp. GD4]|uniref:dynamin family protein n=1 Tax=Paenibacillus sp. GD4 TaxID=3068890 RepID=UPI0027969DE3|nr:dynamin family protein [Paenibacillus sp. GD4]MDQ1909362.1 dynamin family protein [Paenibacillus sp. GD4]